MRGCVWWLLRPAVGYPRAVGRWVASYLVNQDGNTVKLRPRLVRSEHGSRPELFVPEVRHVRLAISCCYEDPVLVNQHYGIRGSSPCPQGERELPDNGREQLARRALAVIEGRWHYERVSL
jgi:hypothetical protein